MIVLGNILSCLKDLFATEVKRHRLSLNPERFGDVYPFVEEEPFKDMASVMQKYNACRILYSILKSGIAIEDMITMALEHSGHRLKRKNLLAMITNGELYVKDKSFLQLSPVYDVTAMDIQDFIKQKLVNPLIP